MENYFGTTVKWIHMQQLVWFAELSATIVHTFNKSNYTRYTSAGALKEIHTIGTFEEH